MTIINAPWQVWNHLLCQRGGLPPPRTIERSIKVLWLCVKMRHGVKRPQVGGLVHKHHVLPRGRLANVVQRLPQPLDFLYACDDDPCAYIHAPSSHLGVHLRLECHVVDVLRFHELQLGLRVLVGLGRPARGECWAQPTAIARTVQCVHRPPSCCAPWHGRIHPGCAPRPCGGAPAGCVSSLNPLVIDGTRRTLSASSFLW